MGLPCPGPVLKTVMPMKKHWILLLFLISAVALCSCGGSKAPTAPIPVEIQTAPSEATVPETLPETAPTAEPTSAPTVPAPRVPGPERIEGNAITVENVSVTFSPELPGSITSSASYSSSGFREEFVLDESQLYAAVRFTLTNKTAEELKISDIHDDFLVELIFDNRYVYSPNIDSWCFFQKGPQTAVLSNSMSVGSVTLGPLATGDVTLYIPCAKALSEEADKPLIAVFTSAYSGYESHEFIIR